MTASNEWRADAACATTDPDAFFPEPDGDGGRAAKRICATCPVQFECLEYAVENEPWFGVWAGTTPGDRRRMRKEAA